MWVDVLKKYLIKWYSPNEILNLHKEKNYNPADPLFKPKCLFYVFNMQNGLHTNTYFPAFIIVTKILGPQRSKVFS